MIWHEKAEEPLLCSVDKHSKPHLLFIFLRAHSIRRKFAGMFCESLRAAQSCTAWHCCLNARRFLVQISYSARTFLCMFSLWLSSGCHSFLPKTIGRLAKIMPTDLTAWTEVYLCLLPLCRPCNPAAVRKVDGCFSFQEMKYQPQIFENGLATTDQKWIKYQFNFFKYGMNQKKNQKKKTNGLWRWAITLNNSITPISFDYCLHIVISILSASISFFCL